jgi:hypothetical protein
MVEGTFREKSVGRNCACDGDSDHHPGDCRRGAERNWVRHNNPCDSTLAFYGAVISAIAIVALFFGQRMAKDYAGAAVLVPYFLVALSAIYLLAQH